jgi:hypothetical protein
MREALVVMPKKTVLKPIRIMKLENSLLETLLKRQEYKITFTEIVNSFKDKLERFDPVKNCFDIEEYFAEEKGNGAASIRKNLLSSNIVHERDIYTYQTKNKKNKMDVKGLYVFIHENVPFYVGISRGIIHRTLQHLRGKSHNTSTLAYNIGLIKYKIDRGEDYAGVRKDFDYNFNVAPAKEFLLKQKIAFLPIKNSEELYLFEIFCAMELKCWLNKFETH